MLRRLLSSILLLGFAASGAAAQEDPTRVYIASFNIPLSDVPAWNRLYHDQTIPILEDLVEEGMISGFSVWLHHTGGEYTLRQAFQGDADTNWDHFWSEYLTRYGETHPEDFERVNGMILAHKDEIWNIDTIEIGEGAAPARYLYEAKFQIPFTDVDEWTNTFQQTMLRAADEAIGDGLLVGYVTESHNTGGRYNWQVLWLLDDLDDLDDLELALFSAAPLDHDMWRLVSAHRDELWQILPPPEN